MQSEGVLKVHASLLNLGLNHRCYGVGPMFFKVLQWHCLSGMISHKLVKQADLTPGLRFTLLSRATLHCEEIISQTDMNSMHKMLPQHVFSTDF